MALVLDSSSLLLLLLLYGRSKVDIGMRTKRSVVLFYDVVFIGIIQKEGMDGLIQRRNEGEDKKTSLFSFLLVWFRSHVVFITWV